jgi:hypothetical protein
MYIPHEAAPVNLLSKVCELGNEFGRWLGRVSTDEKVIGQRLDLLFDVHEVKSIRFLCSAGRLNGEMPLLRVLPLCHAIAAARNNAQPVLRVRKEIAGLGRRQAHAKRRIGQDGGVTAANAHRCEAQPDFVALVCGVVIMSLVPNDFARVTKRLQGRAMGRYFDLCREQVPRF